MNVKISKSTFEDSKEVVIVYWTTIDNLKVFVKSEDVELEYPYTHRVAFSYMETLSIVLDEYPDYISFIEEEPMVKIDNFTIDKGNFIVFIDNGLTKLYFSSISYKQLKELFEELKRAVTKGVRVDVH